MNATGTEHVTTPRPLTLDKITDMDPTPASTPRTQDRRPWYPLVGHRSGLRRNDLTVLASALWVECLERGALSPIPGTVDPDTGNVVPVRL